MSLYDNWMLEPPAFHVGADDVAMIIKTVISTRKRLAAKLETLRNQGWQRNVVVVAIIPRPWNSYLLQRRDSGGIRCAELDDREG